MVASGEETGIRDYGNSKISQKGEKGSLAILLSGNKSWISILVEFVEGWFDSYWPHFKQHSSGPNSAHQNCPDKADILSTFRFFLKMLPLYHVTFNPTAWTSLKNWWTQLAEMALTKWLSNGHSITSKTKLSFENKTYSIIPNRVDELDEQPLPQFKIIFMTHLQ